VKISDENLRLLLLFPDPGGSENNNWITFTNVDGTDASVATSTFAVCIHREENWKDLINNQ
jgi:hypothetical protein